MEKMELNKEKMKNLILYICQNCSNTNKLGATKLNKILYYADFLHYYYRGFSITNDTYVKRQYGPVPKHIMDVLDELEDERKMFIKDIDYFGKNKKEFIPLTDYDIEQFNGYEISLIDKIREEICDNYTAESISIQTHDKIWEIAELGEEIPYYTVFASSFGEIDENDINWAKEELIRLKKAA